MLTVPEKIFSMCWIFGLSVILALGCQAKPPQPRPVPKFEKGEVVVSALTGENLMVLCSAVWAGSIEYQCRIGTAIPVKRDGLFSADTVSSRYAIKWFDEHELRKTKEE